MKKIILFCFMLVPFTINSQESYKLIPYPNELVKQEGTYVFKTNLSIQMPNEFKPELEIMSKVFNDEYYIRLKPSKNGELQFRINPQLDKEEYSIYVERKTIQVESSTAIGCFWAFQTIRQLMVLNADGSYSIACCKIKDKPAFPWRGMMLDVSFVFRQKSVIKTILDEMALLKMNVFHWNLTDARGWRIEISKYPKLTEIGSWRDKSLLLQYPLTGWASTVYDDIPPPEYAYKPTGGYYTKDDIKEIINYASQRHITIVPMINMPGHCAAAIAAYPWLGSNDNIKKVLSPGHGAFNVADEKVCLFLEDVLKEVMELFPGKVIHIGGDEVQQKEWQGNELIKSYMEKNGLENYADLQMKFTNRMNDFISKQGFRMMGWNDIYGKNIHTGDFAMEDSNLKLNKQVIIQFWKGSPISDLQQKSEYMKEVVENGYDFVNSDAHHAYTFFSYKKIPLSKAYHFTPIPEGIKPEYIKHVLGISCFVGGDNSNRVQGFYPLLFPRIAAYAEVGWTQQSNKNYERFTGSLWKLKKHWDEKGILYSDNTD